jgi:hypothetical protein
MESQSARLEREAEETLWQLSGTLEELRGRMTPGRVVDQVFDYTRDGPAAEFLHNFRRDVRQNPMPLVLVGIGVLWLLLASNRMSRAVIASAADRLAQKAEDLSVATGEAVTRTTEWGQQTAARLADRASDVASSVGNTTAEFVSRARECDWRVGGQGAIDFHGRGDYVWAGKPVNYRQGSGRSRCTSGQRSVASSPRGHLLR